MFTSNMFTSKLLNIFCLILPPLYIYWTSYLVLKYIMIHGDIILQIRIPTIECWQHPIDNKLDFLYVNVHSIIPALVYYQRYVFICNLFWTTSIVSMNLSVWGDKLLLLNIPTLHYKRVSIFNTDYFMPHPFLCFVCQSQNYN